MKALITGALCLVLGAAPAPAAPRGAEQIVLTGDGSASAELRLDRAVRLVCCELERRDVDGRTFFVVAGLEVETRGTFGGFAIERARDGRIVKGAVQIPPMDLDDGTVPTFASFGRARRLAPGTYRIHLLGDGPATVRVAAPGLGRTLALEPGGPSAVTASLVELTATSPQQRVAVDVSEDATVVLVSKTEGELAQAHYLAQCLATPGDQCTDPEDYEPWVSPASGGGGGTTIDIHERPAPGPHDAVFTSGSAGLPRGTYGFVLVIG